MTVVSESLYQPELIMTTMIMYVETLEKKKHKPEALRLHQPTVSFHFSITAVSNAAISVCLQVGLKYVQFQLHLAFFVRCQYCNLERKAHLV